MFPLTRGFISAFPISIKSVDNFVEKDAGTGRNAGMHAVRHEFLIGMAIDILFKINRLQK